jgi:hypothetical protein
MTVGELIKELKKYDSGLLVGGRDHFGSYLPIEYIEYENNENVRTLVFYDEGDKWEYMKALMNRRYKPKIKHTPEEHIVPPFLNIAIEWAGNEPD